MLTTLTDDLFGAMIEHAENWMEQSGRRPKQRRDGRWAWVGGPLWRAAANGLPPEVWHHICLAESDTQASLRYDNKADAVNDLAVALMALKIYGPPAEVKSIPVSITTSVPVAV